MSSNNSMGVGSGASAVRAMSARNRGISSSTASISNNGALSTLPNNIPLHSSTLGKKPSILSLTSNDGKSSVTGSHYGGGGPSGLSVSFSVGASNMPSTNLNNNHPPGIYRTNFVIPGTSTNNTPLLSTSSSGSMLLSKQSTQGGFENMSSKNMMGRSISNNNVSAVGRSTNKR